MDTCESFGISKWQEATGTCVVTGVWCVWCVWCVSGEE